VLRYSLDELLAAVPQQRRQHDDDGPLARPSLPGPFDALAEAARWADLWAPAGWTPVRTERDGAELWLRPGGAMSEYSVRCGGRNGAVAVVHSEEAGLPAGAGQKLTMGRIFAHLHHGGDESAAAADLRAAAAGNPASSPAARGLPVHVLLAIRERCGVPTWDSGGGSASAASLALGGTPYRRSQLAALPAIEPLVVDLISRRSTVLVVGPPGVGKTFFMLGVACAVGMGVKWLGRAVHPGKVLYIVGEGAHGLNQRLIAWEQAWDVTVADDRIEFRVKPGSLAVDATWVALAAYAVEFGASLVVIDTFSSCAPDADETKDASRITRHLSDLAAAIDGTTVLVHHPGWGDTGRARGGSQLEANPDEVLVLARGPDASGAVTVTRKKVKEGPSGVQMWLRLKPAHGSAYLESTSAADQEAPLRPRVLQLLTDYDTDGATVPQIALALGLGDDRSYLYRVLRGLRSDGLTTVSGKPRHERHLLAGKAP
jgi:hypothetical protein